MSTSLGWMLAALILSLFARDRAALMREWLMVAPYDPEARRWHALWSLVRWLAVPLIFVHAYGVIKGVVLWAM